MSEVFQFEFRALAIAIFYALGTAIGGAGAPYLLGSLIETGERASVFQGYLLGAGLMIFAAVIQAIWASPPSESLWRRSPGHCRQRRNEAAYEIVQSRPAIRTQSRLELMGRRRLSYPELPLPHP